MILLALLTACALNEFPGTGAAGNGIGTAMIAQNHYEFEWRSTPAA